MGPAVIPGVAAAGVLIPAPVDSPAEPAVIPAAVWILFAAVERALTPEPVDWAAAWALFPALISPSALGVLVWALLPEPVFLGLALPPEPVFLVVDERLLPVPVVALPRARVRLGWGGFPALGVPPPAEKLALPARDDNPQRAPPVLSAHRSSAGSRPPFVGAHGSGWRTARDSASLSGVPCAVLAAEPHAARCARPSAPAWAGNSARRGRR